MLDSKHPREKRNDSNRVDDDERRTPIRSERTSGSDLTDRGLESDTGEEIIDDDITVDVHEHDILVVSSDGASRSVGRTGGPGARDDSRPSHDSRRSIDSLPSIGRTTEFRTDGATRPQQTADARDRRFRSLTGSAPTHLIHQDSTAGSRDATSDDLSGSASGEKVRLANADDCHADPTILLLHRRLKAVSFLLGFGLLFLLVGFQLSSLFPSAVLAGFDGTALQAPLLLHLFVVVSLLGCGFALTFMKSSICWQLHLVELAVFGFPAVLFFVLEFQYVVIYTSVHDVLPSTTIGWILLMFTYALFIPNRWPRACLFLATFALLPAALTIYLAFYHSGCCEAANAGNGYVIQTILQLAIAATTSVVGVGMIGGLRVAATQAQELGQYVLHEKIGEGGMGEVYLGEHQMMKRPCAIKLIRPERAGDPRILARFEREVRLTAQLSHWNNVDVYDFGRSEDGTFFYAMEYLPGLTLKELVGQHGPLPPGRVIHLLKQVCNALEEAHRLRLIHRDIKPSNIIAAERGGIYDVAKLVDFGLAKPLIENHPINVSNDHVITGSPRYMSPEQATGETTPDPRSDIYSLGCVAYFMLTGRPPFDETQVIRAIMAHATKTPESPSTLNDSIPDDLETVVLRCISKSPDDRFTNVVELRDALNACTDEGTWGDREANQWWQLYLNETQLE